MHWDYILLLAVLAVFVPWRSNARIRTLLGGPSLSSSERIQLYFSTMAFQWIAAALLVWRAVAHHLPLAELGFALPNPRRALVVTVVISLLLILNQIFGLRRLAALPPPQGGIIPRLAERLLPRSPLESCVAVALVFSVAICEEVIYRGFVQTVFQIAFTGSVVAGAVISSLFFSLAHLYQGRKGIITTVIVGLIFATARIWTGSLFPSIFIHFCVDLSAGIVASRIPHFPTAQSTEVPVGLDSRPD